MDMPFLFLLTLEARTTADIEGTNDHFVFGGKHGYGIYNKETQSYKYIKKFWTDFKDTEIKEKILRANDGSVDAKGRFWCGTMNDPLEKEPTTEGIQAHSIMIMRHMLTRYKARFSV